VKAESGRIFDVEVQIDKDYMNERGFFYGIRIGEEEFKSGSSYIHMPEVRVINLVDFYVRDDKTHVVEPVVVSFMRTTRVNSRLRSLKCTIYSFLHFVKNIKHWNR